MTQREKAIELLKQLDVNPFFVDKFVNEGKVTVFEDFAGYDIAESSELEQKIKEIERDRHCIVYAVTHEVLTFGECYSLLMVPVYEEDWDGLLRYLGSDDYYVLAYVWNKSHEECSESGFISVYSCFGGLVRIG